MKNQSNEKPMRYIIYARKSSEGEDRQVQSIDDQVNFAKKIANEKGLKIVETFSESKSARKPGRSVFNEMISFIEEGKASGILCWKMNRLARNPIDGGKIQWLLQESVIKKIIASDRTYLPEDNSIISSVDMGTSTQFSRDLSVDVKRGLKSKLEKGVWPNYAPIGYRNKNKGIVVNKKQTRYIERAFKVYSKGDIGIKELAEQLFQEGFRSKAGNKYHKSKVNKILRNPFYYGVILYNNEYYSGIHESIISKQLFDEVQKVLDGKNRTKRQKRFFTFRGFLRCEKCGCVLTADTKKGYNYYYCTNGKGNCEEHKKYLREEKVEEIVAKSLEKLSFNPEAVENKEKYGHNRNYQEDILETLSGQLKVAETRQDNLLKNLCDERIPGELYDKKNKEFGKQKADLESEINKIKKNLDKEYVTLEQKKKLFLKACYAKKEFLQATKSRQTKTLQDLLWNATVKNQELAKVSFKSPYELIANEPNKHDFCKLRRGRDLNP